MTVIIFVLKTRGKTCYNTRLPILSMLMAITRRLHFFAASAVGTAVTIGSGEYSVTEEIPSSPFFPRLNIRTHLSPDVTA
jgi:hypothetical protein